MLSTTILESLECALSTHLKHISINPISLSCGHLICNECIPKGSQTNITCVHCKKTQNVQENQEESVPAKVLFNVFIDNMFDYVEDKFKNSLRSLEDSRFEENLRIRIDLLKNDIDVRIESLKSELDTLREKIFDKLDKIGSEIIKDKFKNVTPSEAYESFQKNYNELVEYNKKEKKKTEEDFIEFQSNLKKLYETNERIFKNDFELKFNASNFALSEASIGETLFVFCNFDSKILNRSEFFELFNLCEFDKNKNLALLYRGSRDGFGAKNFHEKCDGRSPTLTVIRTIQEYVFGGYTEANWSSNNQVISDVNAFIFSFKNSIGSKFKSKVQTNIGSHIMCGCNFGPIFGGNNAPFKNRNNYNNYNNYNYDTSGTIDICISDNSNTSGLSSTSFPNTYSSNQNTLQKYCLNGGESRFNVAEIEVFLLQNK